MRRSLPIRARFLAPIALAAALLSGPAVLAQSPAPPPASSGQGAAISDQKLDAAVAAMRQVANIKQDYQQRLEEAQPEEREKLANEAEGALTKAVTDQGISVEEYSEILTVAQNDPSVRERILQRLRTPGQ
ncbi:MAG TPA: DUF4168 domain-containing protein [Xanthobacteraceae bacterium]|nr:DUF4168 domain-containing protein [Xanthobacteraceae bacterium]